MKEIFAIADCTFAYSVLSRQMEKIYNSRDTAAAPSHALQLMMLVIAYNELAPLLGYKPLSGRIGFLPTIPVVQGVAMQFTSIVNALHTKETFKERPWAQKGVDLLAWHTGTFCQVALFAGSIALIRLGKPEKGAAILATMGTGLLIYQLSEEKRPMISEALLCLFQ